MAKKFQSTERFLRPDAQYQSRLIGKFINCVMRAGKKSIAERIFYRAARYVEERQPGIDFVQFFETCISNVKPRRQQALAFRWILAGARTRKGRPMHVRLAEELLDAHRNEGHAMHQRENILRMAEASKAFAHFAW